MTKAFSILLLLAFGCSTPNKVEAIVIAVEPSGHLSKTTLHDEHGHTGWIRGKHGDLGDTLFVECHPRSKVFSEFRIPK